MRARIASTVEITPGEIARLTRRQERAVERILGEAFRWASGQDNGRSYEFKALRIEQLSPESERVMVIVEVGKVGDEANLGSVFCRTRGQFFIGPRGAISCGHGERGKRAKTRKHPLIYGWSH